MPTNEAEVDYPNGITINLDEDECVLILKALEDRHVYLQTHPNTGVPNEMEAINRLEERIKEAE